MPTLPMFPLGGVLFPALVLPLHVFEPRYRELVRHCLVADEPEFGVVLIERGSEVGGGDVRSTVGTVARILEAGETEDGRWALVAAGDRRVRVTQWLDDDPYPRAEVEDWPDEAASPAVLAAACDRVLPAFRRVLGLRSELGEPTPPATIELADDPRIASYQVSALAGFGPLDQQRLLSVAATEARLDLLEALLADEADFLVSRLGLD